MSKRPFPMAAALVAALLCLSMVRSDAQGQALRVLSSNGVRAAVEDLKSQSERHAGGSIAITFGTSASTKQRIMAGEAFDVAILTTDAIEELLAAGKLASGTRAEMGRSGIGVGVRAKTATPDIRTPDALKRTLVAAKSVTYASDGASRPHIVKMLEAFGIADAVNAKTILEQGSVRAAARVANGDAELLITLVSEIVPIPGIELAGPLPSEFQNYVSFAAAIGSSASNVEGARAFIRHLSSVEASPTFTAKGIERR